MTLQEAIKSGKPFKRKSFFDYYHVKDDHVYADSKSVAAFSVESYLADDWELKPDEPKWLKGWTSGRMYSCLEGAGYYVYPTKHGDVLLIDSRPVKALMDKFFLNASYVMSYSADGQRLISDVEKLLKE